MFLVSGPNLVVEACRAGVLGTSVGQSVASAIAAGADPMSIGTRFFATHESMALVEQKTMICESDVDMSSALRRPTESAQAFSP